ncbi:MAG: phage portal protein [Pseudomonadota bacterium]
MGIWSNWIGAKAAPADAGLYLPQWLRAGEAPAASVCGYAAQYDEVYRTNPVGLRSVRLVAENVGGLALFSDRDEVHALVGAGLMERIAAALLLHGNAYVRVVTGSRGKPVALDLVRPDRVEVVTDAVGHPIAYDVRGGRDRVRIAARDGLYRRQVVHIRSLNPDSDVYGLGCLEAATPAASIHNRASRWNKALLDNAARPSGALSYEPADGASLSAAQYDALKVQIAEQFAGAGNAGRPLLLDGGMKWLPMALTPADMDFVALKEAAARDIALAFGVPPVLVGLPGDSTYANAREAGRALMRLTVLPLAGKILGALGELLGDWLGPVELRVDKDEISEMAEDRERLWRQVSGADFLTRDEKRRQLGFDLEEAE